MLTAMEDLLDSWPGTLIVVSHDRYLLERVTDQQYAILGGRLRHVPGGVDEYLSLVERSGKGSPVERSGKGSPVERSERNERSRNQNPPDFDSASGSAQSAVVSGAELRALQKELASIERKMDKSQTAVGTLHAQMAEHDQSDYVGLASLTEQLRALESEHEQLEERWLELSEQVG